MSEDLGEEDIGEPFYADRVRALKARVYLVLMGKEMGTIITNMRSG